MPHYLDSAKVEKNFSMCTFSPDLSSNASTLNGTLTLTVDSCYTQVITGSASGFKLKLPNATTLINGWQYEIWNTSTAPFTLNYNDSSILVPIPQNTMASLVLQDTSTTNGSWLIARTFTGSALGVLNYSVTDRTPYTLSSGTADVTITGMTVTPVAGTYFVFYDGGIQITGNNNTVRTSIYKGGVLVTSSLRTIASSVSTFNTTHQTKDIIQFDGATICEIKVARSSNSLTINGRSLILIRMGD